MAGDEAPRSRSEEKAEAVRATLTPFEPGERPWPVVACSLLAFVLGALTAILYAAGTTVDGTRPRSTVVVVYVCLMLGLGINVWRMRYWAVLAFQLLLALAILGFSLRLISVTSAAGLVVCLTSIAVGGTLFWKLVRIAGRIQVTDRMTT